MKELSGVAFFTSDTVDDLVQVLQAVAAESDFDTFVVEDFARFAASLALVAQASPHPRNGFITGGALSCEASLLCTSFCTT